MDKEVRQLLDTIQHVQGVRVKHGSKHVRVYLNDAPVTTIPHSPSDYRWRQNALAQLRRAGVLTRPDKESKVSESELMSVTQLRERVTALPNRSEFARFIVYDLAPDMRSYKNYESAISSLGQLATRKSYGLSEWAQELLTYALREWDARLAATTNGDGPTEPVITDEELDEAIAIDQGEGRPEPTGVAMVDLARSHEELTERIDVLAEQVKVLTDQLDALVAEREPIAAAILAHLTETEGRPS